MSVSFKKIIGVIAVICLCTWDTTHNSIADDQETIFVVLNSISNSRIKIFNEEKHLESEDYISSELSRSNSQYNGEIKRPYRWNKDVIVAIGTHDLDLYRIQESFFRRMRKFYSHDVFYNLGQRTKTFPGNFIIYNKTPEELETRTREIDGTLPVLKKIKQGDRCVGQIKIKDDSIDNAFLFVAPSLPMSHQDVCLRALSASAMGLFNRHIPTIRVTTERSADGDFAMDGDIILLERLYGNGGRFK